MTVLGLDLGTSAVKALLADEHGEVLAVASSPCAMQTAQPGWAEADPMSWLDAAAGAIAGVLDGVRDEPVRAIGLAGQMHGVVLCDEDGAPLRPALLWPDRRANRELELWRALPRRRRVALANPLVPGMAGPLLAWLRRHEPAVLDDAAWALQPKDWLRLVMTGDAAADPSDASATLLWDLTADTWAHDVAEAVGIPPGLLAPVRRSDARAGSLRPAIAGRLGLESGLPVHVGAADTAAALLGAGLTRAGQRLLNLGTGAQLVRTVEDAEPRFPAVAHCYRDARGGWYAMVAIQNAGLALRWARSVLGDHTPVPPGRRAGLPGPFFYPHLTGERPPLGTSASRGAWAGLGMHHTAADLLRATYEGVAHAIRQARDVLDHQSGGEGPRAPLHLMGGGIQEPGFADQIADVLGEPLVLRRTAHATAIGAAMLASGASPKDSGQRVVEPDEGRTAAAGQRYESWLRGTHVTLP